jgi:hypothetical protein
MIPGPTPRLSDCYLTDQRSFDNYIHAISRMHSEVKVDFSTFKPRVTPWHNCDETTELDCEDGAVECKDKGSKDRMNFVLLAPLSPRKVIIEMKCSANNPCSPSSRIFGEIDYVGLITFDRDKRAIEFDGYVDQFPAFEAYATINEQKGVTLFRVPPPPGHTVMNLPGKANRRIKAKLEDRDGDGVFEESATQ